MLYFNVYIGLIPSHVVGSFVVLVVELNRIKLRILFRQFVSPPYFDPMKFINSILRKS